MVMCIVVMALVKGSTLVGADASLAETVTLGFSQGMELFGPYAGQLGLVSGIYILSVAGLFSCCHCFSRGNRKRQIERIKFQQLASLRKKPENTLDHKKERTFSETKKDVRKK